MTIEIMPLGGLGEIGKNMTALRLDDINIIVDMGIKLENILGLDDSDIGKMSREKLIEIGGIPNDSEFRNRDVSAILLTHGHLDHIGAIGKLAHEYEAPIYATPFTIELARHVIRDERVFDVKNELRSIENGEKIEVDGVEIEFIKGTHSIPQTALPAIHSSEGTVLCAVGFKLDEEPLLGDTTDYERLSQLNDNDPLISLICAVRADDPNPTPSEAHVKKMLKEEMVETSNRGKALFVTCFSTHIARIKSIIEISHEVGREPIILGRSIVRQCRTAIKLGIVDLPSDLIMCGRSGSVQNALEEIKDSRENYTVIATGHQGEPNAILSRIADDMTPFKIQGGDEVIFSASVIPNPLNEANRDLLEAKLEAQGAHIHRDVHASGHAGQPGTRELIKIVNPDHIVPVHGTPEKLGAVTNIGRKMGYSSNQLHLLENGKSLELNT